MADEDQEVVQPVFQPTAALPSEDSDAVKALLSVVDAIGDSLSASDRAKYEGLIARAREASNA